MSAYVDSALDWMANPVNKTALKPTLDALIKQGALAQKDDGTFQVNSGFKTPLHDVAVDTQQTPVHQTDSGAWMDYFGQPVSATTNSYGETNFTRKVPYSSVGEYVDSTLAPVLRPPVRYQGPTQTLDYLNGAITTDKESGPYTFWNAQAKSINAAQHDGGGGLFGTGLFSGGGIPIISDAMNVGMKIGDKATGAIQNIASKTIDPVMEGVVAPIADTVGEGVITPVGDASGGAVQYGMDSGIIPTALFAAATGIPTDFTVANGGVGSAAGTIGASSSAGATNAAGQVAAQEAAKTSIIDTAFKQAMIGAETGALTAGMSGQDPLQGALKGAVAGGVFGATSAAIPGDLVTTGSKGFDAAANTAINRGAASGAAALATGGDVGNAVIGGGLIGAASPTIDTKIADPALRSAAKGAIQGGVSAGLSGNDVLTGAGVGAAGGYTGAKFAEWSGYKDGTIEQAMMAGLGTTVGQQAASEVIGQEPKFLPVTSPTAPAGTMGLIERQAKPSQGLLNGYQSLAVKRTNANRR